MGVRPGAHERVDRPTSECSRRVHFIPSMSRKGGCWDNAVADSLFSTFKTELVGSDSYTSHGAATCAIGDYIDSFYNTRRRFVSRLY